MKKLKYLVVLDFEATCIKDKKINPQEIIGKMKLINKIKKYKTHFISK